MSAAKISKECEAYLEWQATQFMVPCFRWLGGSTAREYLDLAPLAETEEDEDGEDMSGWYGRLSAPGYMDATDWDGPYETEEEAAMAMFEMYGDDMPEPETDTPTE